MGTTGKTADELEVVLLKMKSILDRTLAENARMKRLLAHSTNRVRLNSLQDENKRLRERLEQAEDATSAALAKHQIESDKSIAHLASEYDKLRAQLLKVRLSCGCREKSVPFVHQYSPHLTLSPLLPPFKVRNCFGTD